MEPGDSAQPCCAFCDSRRLGLVMDFGRVGLAGGFLKPEQFATEPTFPMRLHFCKDCYAVQVTDKVPADVMFKDYFYFSSSIGTLRDHFRDYAGEVTRRFLDPAKATVLEFGCNDGVLLRPLADQGIRTVIGVDPASNVVATINDSRIKVVNDYFTESVARSVVAEHGGVDLIMANNVYAHIPDIQGTTRAVAAALGPDGVFAFEVHYLGKVIDELQYDMVYHEHLYYYSLLSVMNHLARYDMMVFDIKPIPIHAGSIRFYTCKKGSKHSASVSPAVKALEAEERARGFDRFETFQAFSATVAAHRDELIGLLNRLRAEGKRIAGYGASGRANTMIQWCGISHDHLDYMIDDAPAKAGFYTPKSHFQIHPSSILGSDNPPDYLLVFAWSFFDEIRKRNAAYLEKGGRMILPLPEVSIFPPSNA
ncbi:class I SAM-dependent methyltransferase [Bradyrhizobium manausense]|uniref:class I SAM-dependent methyltransferase n=1 Tax=Bradyrhizobium manausense TaxID=989370 RepID=UPI001BA86B77|nr:class I SAM-dependent methyltransferase [Bradyrhizobium manausense]MBR0688854.1 class I SAM-dependent methyltransferase [Bradyrhizobium manausense]MBR0723667.1 class I SAM-dependent methyltransferase [Bradyrhizobium manausense]